MRMLPSQTWAGRLKISRGGNKQFSFLDSAKFFFHRTYTHHFSGFRNQKHSHCNSQNLDFLWVFRYGIMNLIYKFCSRRSFKKTLSVLGAIKPYCHPKNFWGVAIATPRHQAGPPMIADCSSWSWQWKQFIDRVIYHHKRNTALVSPIVFLVLRTVLVTIFDLFDIHSLTRYSWA
jgi:hypothetical protein